MTHFFPSQSLSLLWLCVDGGSIWRHVLLFNLYPQSAAKIILFFSVHAEVAGRPFLLACGVNGVTDSVLLLLLTRTVASSLHPTTCSICAPSGFTDFANKLLRLRGHNTSYFPPAFPNSAVISSCPLSSITVQTKQTTQLSTKVLIIEVPTSEVGSPTTENRSSHWDDL